MNKRVLILSNVLLVLIIFYLVYKGDYINRVLNKLGYTHDLITLDEKPYEVNFDYCDNAPDTVRYSELNYEWVKVNCDAEFAPRDGGGAIVYNDSLWLIGGWNPDDKVNFPLICNNEVWNSFDGKHWNLVKENSFVDESFDTANDWEGRHRAGYVVFKDKMWIVGGDPNQGHYQNEIWNSKNGREWNLVTDTLPWANRVLHYTVVYNDKIWVMGGQTIPQIAEAEEVFYSDVWNSEDGIIWSKVETNNCIWSPRGLIGGSVVFKDRIWVLGGGRYHTPNYSIHRMYNDVWSTYDGVNWENHTQNALWEPRIYHDAGVWDGKLWVLEGSSSGQIRKTANRNDVYYSEDGELWMELPNTPWKPRHASSIFIHNDCMYVVAGNNMESDVWKLQKTSTKK